MPVDTQGVSECRQMLRACDQLRLHSNWGSVEENFCEEITATGTIV